MPRTKIGGGGTRTLEHNLYDLRHRFPTTGNIWFVDSGAASGGNGLSPEGAVLTIDAAINLATAANGDIIVVMEGHAETIAGAAGVAQDVAGLTIVGLGRGRNRPVITFATATGASWDVSAANSYITGLTFVNAIDAQTAMFNVTAADCTFDDCRFMLGDACTQAVLGILTTAAGTRLTVKNCHMHGSVDAGVSAAIRLVGGDAHLIEDNIIVGAFATTGNISNITTAATMVCIRRNHLVNRTADGNNKLLVAEAGTTGLLAENRGGIIDSSCPAPVTAAGIHVGGNWFSSAAGVTASVLM